MAQIKTEGGVYENAQEMELSRIVQRDHFNASLVEQKYLRVKE